MLEYFFFNGVGVVERFGNLEPLGRALSPDHIEDHLATIRADLEGRLLFLVLRSERKKGLTNLKTVKVATQKRVPKYNCDK